MRPSPIAVLWLGLFCLDLGIYAFPAGLSPPDVSFAPSPTPDPQIHVIFCNGIANSDTCLDLPPADITKRGKKKKGKAKTIPDSPPLAPKTPTVPKKPQTPPAVPDTTPGTPGPSRGRTRPAVPPPQRKKKTKPKKAATGEMPHIRLGTCGSEAEGKTLTGKTPRPQSKSPSRSKSSRSPAPPTPGKGGGKKNQGGTSAKSSGGKKLYVCKDVELKSPVFPNAGDITTKFRDRWQSKIEAFNAKVIDPCEDNYEFEAKTVPKDIKDDLHTPDGIRNKDKWNTEHVMDGQIVKKFFYEMFDLGQIPRDELPKQWRSSLADGRKSATLNQCAYLKEFWKTRWARETNAMEYLLEVFPGDNEHAEELVLLPGRLNGKKSSLFTVEAKKDIIGLAKWERATFHEKIDELRELVLLIKYLNEKKIQNYFKAVSIRIKNRLDEMEDPKGFFRKTDDFWFKKAKKENKDSKGLEDKPDEKYVSLALSKRWDTWIYEFVTDRVNKMEALKERYFKELVQLHTDMLAYKDFTAAEKTEAKKRMVALEKNIDVKVKVAGLVDKPEGGSRSPSRTPSPSPKDSLPIRKKPGNPSGQ